MQLHIYGLAWKGKIDANAFMSKAPAKNEATPSDAVTRFWIQLMRSQRIVLAAIEKDLKAAKLPQLGWYDVLWELVQAQDGRLRPYEIEARTLLAQHNLSRLLDRMEEAGLVMREVLPEDGRGRWVRVTQAGRDMQKRMWEIYAASIQRHVGNHMNDTEQAGQLAAMLERLTRGA